jgi:hypothetical protein
MMPLHTSRSCLRDGGLVVAQLKKVCNKSWIQMENWQICWQRVDTAAEFQFAINKHLELTPSPAIF